MRTNFKNLFFGLAAAALLQLAQLAVIESAHAAEDPKGWIGGVIGLSVPNYRDTTARPIWGLSGGAKLGTELGIGAYYLTSTKDETSNGTTAKFAYDLYGVELGYHFEGEARGAYFAGRLGMSQVKSKSGALDVSTSPMHWGMAAGYNHFIGSSFSLGGEVSYISVAKASTTVLSTPVDQDAFSTLNFLASAKLWF